MGRLSLMGVGHINPTMSTQPSEDDRSEYKNIGSSSAWWSRVFRWLRAFELRDQWWRFLDHLETKRGARWALGGVVFAILLVVVSVIWIHPWWVRRNAVSMARQWIEAGKINYAADVVQKALEKDLHDPELWTLAAELARLNKQNAMEVEYAHRAAQAQPTNPRYALEWAGAALRAELPDVAEQALASVSAQDLEKASYAQRLLGELERRKQQYDGAIAHFEAALRVDGAGAVDEVPLGLCLIVSHDTAQRERGLALLGKWTADREWGAGALQILLKDAVAQNDRLAMAKWAVALRAHPRCTVGDMPNCLAALARADEGKFAEELARLRQAHLASPEAAAQLIGWLNQIGRSADALDWMKTLPEQALARPPLSVAKAEALRMVGDWPALQGWAAQGDWGGDLDFLRWAYGLLAAHNLGDSKLVDELWLKLNHHAQANTAHALFAGSTVFTWGLVSEAESLWWQVAGQNNNLAIEALGTLARRYQMSRDAAGQYKVFDRLHSMHPQDVEVTNNFAFFAALTGNRVQLAEQASRENLARYPTNLTYLATHAFVILMRGNAEQALKLIQPLADQAGKSSAVAFVYGLALAGTGEKEKARAVLHKLDPASLTLHEIALIKTALGD